MRTLWLTLLTASVALPSTAHAQGVAEVMAGIQNGGGWTEIAITKGQGATKTVTIPTAGLTVAGCLNVWQGHSGTWEIRAHERIADEVIEIDAVPGVGVPFSHTFGMLAQVDFDFRWSEPRDTTLLLWIGVALGSEAGEKSCEPTFEGR